MPQRMSVGTNKWGIAASGERMLSLSAVLDSAQVSRALGDVQVTARVEYGQKNRGK